MLVAIIGFAAGFASALLGIGGGIVIVPALLLVLRLPIARATGISLIAIAPAAAGALVAEALLYPLNIRWDLGLALGASGVAGAIAGRRLLLRLHDGTLRAAFAIVLVVAAVRMAGAGHLSSAGVITTALSATLLVWPIGLAAGLTSVLFGVGGGGLVIVPDVGIATRLIGPGLAGGLLGIRTANALPPAALRLVFAGILLVVAMQLWWRPRPSNAAALR